MANSPDKTPPQTAGNLFNMVLMACVTLIVISMFAICAAMMVWGGDHTTAQVLGLVSVFGTILGVVISQFKIINQISTTSEQLNNKIDQNTAVTVENKIDQDSAIRANQQVQAQAVQAAKSVAAQAVVMADVTSKATKDSIQASLEDVVSKLMVEVAELKKSTNGRMDELLKEREARAYQEGYAKCLEEIKKSAVVQSSIQK